jgi:hypothetical protein
MDDVFSTLLPLIPLALLIAVRIAGDKKKKAAAEERKKLAATLAQAAETPFKPSGGVSEGSDISAHNLKPDEDTPPAEPRPEASRLRKKVHTLLAQPELPAPAPVLSEPPQPVRPAPAQAAAASAETGTAAALGRLPPLKRAVVFAELLGPPKSLGAD